MSKNVRIMIAVAAATLALPAMAGSWPNIPARSASAKAWAGTDPSGPTGERGIVDMLTSHRAPNGAVKNRDGCWEGA